MALKIVFFGSPEDAVPALEKIVEAGHEIVAVYTRPDRAAGRSRRARPTPVKAAAEAMGLPVETPAGLRKSDAQERLSALGADLFVVVAYGRILPQEVLDMPRLGMLNIHPSLLPKHRGPSPVSTAILNGDSETGVTLMLLDAGMDSGPTLVQSDPVKLTGDERSGELTARLFRIGAEMLPAAIEGLANGSLKPTAQDEAQVTVTSLVEKDHGQINWRDSAARIERMTRAYDPWPGAFTSLNGKNLKVISAAVTDHPNPPNAGVLVYRDRRMFAGTGDRALELLQVQPEGRRPMRARDFINGNPDADGATLGS